MTFPYYDNLSAAKQRVYRKSDAIDSVPVRDSAAIHPVTIKLKKSLEADKRRDVAAHASEVCHLVCEGLDIEPLDVKIKSRRPSGSTEELQGLYERTEGEPALLTVWMKTAAKGQVVAFKSFIRTVLHELCHHIDYDYFDLADSLHTEGFFKREAFLYRQVVPIELRQAQTERRGRPRKKPAKETVKEPEQLWLF
jgi:hypothetical protein